MYDDRMYEYEAPEPEFCGCEEDNICHECRARHARYMIQAGVIAQEDGAPLMQLGTADPRDGVIDELLVDAAIADELAARSVRWTLSTAAPRKAPGVALIGNGLYVRTGGRRA